MIKQEEERAPSIARTVSEFCRYRSFLVVKTIEFGNFTPKQSLILFNTNSGKPAD